MKNNPALYPHEVFHLRKIAVWAVIGVLNPLWWATMLAFEREINITGIVAGALIWPSAVGALIALFRLKKQNTTTNELSAFVLCWAVATLPIYTLAFIMWVSNFGTEISAVSGIVPAILGLVGLTLVVSPFAFVAGFFPAILAAFISYWIIRFTLFTKAANPTTPP